MATPSGTSGLSERPPCGAVAVSGAGFGGSSATRRTSAATRKPVRRRRVAPRRFFSVPVGRLRLWSDVLVSGCSAVGAAGHTAQCEDGIIPPTARRIAIIIVVALALPVGAVPETTTAVGPWIAKRTTPLSMPLVVVLAAEAPLVFVVAT